MKEFNPMIIFLQPYPRRLFLDTASFTLNFLMGIIRISRSRCSIDFNFFAPILLYLSLTLAFLKTNFNLESIEEIKPERLVVKTKEVGNLEIEFQRNEKGCRILIERNRNLFNKISISKFKKDEIAEAIRVIKKIVKSKGYVDILAYPNLRLDKLIIFENASKEIDLLVDNTIIEIKSRTLENLDRQIEDIIKKLKMVIYLYIAYGIRPKKFVYCIKSDNYAVYTDVSDFLEILFGNIDMKDLWEVNYLIELLNELGITIEFILTPETCIEIY